jgi:phosphoglycolate phosphatase-like HAD superfamily hydrolase
LLYLFDIDGTILLTGGAGTRAINEIFAERYGLDDAMRDVSPGGKTDPIIFGEIFARRLGRAPEPGEIEELIEIYVPLLEREIPRSDRFRTMPAAIETVRHFAELAGIALGVATGNVQAAARAKLRHIDLWDCFGFGGFGDDSADRAELVAVAIERGRAHAGRDFAGDQVVIVGDTVRDIVAAHACGARAVGVPTGSTDRETLERAGADAVIDTLAELPGWHRAQ